MSEPTQFGSPDGPSITFDPDHGVADFTLPPVATPAAQPSFTPIAGYSPVTLRGAWSPAAIQAARFRVAQRQLVVANHPVARTPRAHSLSRWLDTQLREIIAVIHDRGTTAAPIAPVWFLGSWRGLGSASRLSATAKRPFSVLRTKLFAAVSRLVGPSWKRQIVVWQAEWQLGVDYSWGGGDTYGPTPGSSAKSRDTVGFDCSHLIRYAYAGIGVKLPEGTGSLIKQGTSVDRGQLKAGDLVFTDPVDPTTNKRELHVVMSIGNGQVISAPHTGAHVRIEPLSAYTGDDFVSARRIIN